MITIRKFNEQDLDAIQQIHFMSWLQLQWQKDFHGEDAFVAVDDSNQVVGVAALSYSATWYYIDRPVTHIPDFQMNLEYHVKEDHPQTEQIKLQLLTTMKEHFATYKKKYPDRTISMRCWCEDSSIADMSFLLKNGLYAHCVTPVLAFDLTKDIPNYSIPSSIEIGIHSFEGNGMKQYLQANEMGFDQVQDSEQELWFRLGGETTKVFTAKDGEQVISSTTVWGMGEGRSATENIFTIPAYRHKNIARATLSTALQYLKENGEKQASLTVLGTNRPALAMYYSMGYELIYNLIEMRYTL
ncbi:GNAT family N-acetyltransferase [Anaerosporobacter faecicola]|uniref:GNAT family N-acetyltransferase n=1 Tax=Anaerosporobacter faecicola TaxID=2718714 RepID=UPI00143A6153|nr:GNAT family N-acetyltransferase [Anaerosporobacter faecicola]